MFRPFSSRSTVSFVLSVWSLFLLIVQPCVAFSPSVRAEASTIAEQRAIQVLSRLSFGPRPSDLDVVKKLGIGHYIERQLSPDTIEDSAFQKRLEKLPTLNLSNPTIAELYNPPKPTPSPTPAAAKAADTVATSGNMMMEATEMPAPAAAPTPSPKPTPTPKNPGMVVNELQRAKLLRAVYSERQLYEVMVDFWENHFSIFANKDADRWLLTGFDRDTVRPFAMNSFGVL